MILSHGNEGPLAAGHVVAAFGGFLMGGDVVIGLIVFGILLVVNFMVITKGSGRIAEVAARFSLDAMPGKQMAIDADLSAGADRREGGAPAPQGPGGGERLLRRHGRRGEVRARRRDRRADHHRDQHPGRPGDRHGPARHAVRRRRGDVHHADGGRRAGLADPRAAGLHRGRHRGDQGRHRGHAPTPRWCASLAAIRSRWRWPPAPRRSWRCCPGCRRCRSWRWPGWPAAAPGCATSIRRRRPTPPPHRPPRSPPSRRSPTRCAWT